MMDNPPVRVGGAPPPAPRAAEPILDVWPLEDEGPELREYLRVLARRRWLVALFFGAVMATVGVLTFLETPLYSAEAVLLIEPSDPRVIDIEHVIGESFGYESAYYTTQHELLRSRSLAARVIHDEGLAEEAIFLDHDRGPTAQLAALVQLPVALVSHWLAPPREETAGDLESWLVDLYQDRLWIDPVRDSRLVRLYWTSPDPELAARVVNAHARTYIAQGLELRTRASEEARRFLEERLGELRSRVEESEAALNAYRRRYGIVSLDDKSNVVIDRLADLNQRLTQAEAERIAREADARLVSERDSQSLPAVLESPLVRTLKEDLARLQGEYAFLAQRFKPGYPRRAQLEAQISEGRGRLEGEIGRIVAGIESALLAAQANERELRAKVEEQKDEALRLKDVSVEYAILEHDAETSRQLYDSVRQRIKETSVAAELRASNVFVIDPATPPLDPASPRPARNLGFGLLLGLAGGIGLAFLAEYLDNRLRSPQDVERSLRLPSLGVVPDFAKLEGARARPRANGQWSALAQRNPLDPEPPAAVTEAYRAIRTSILLSQAGEPPRTILFTSGTESEGKTTTALHVALMFARLGSPVLFVEADLRRPRCHRLLGIEEGPGLTEVLAGQEGKLRRLALHDAELHFLGAGSPAPNPTELLGSQRMREVLDRMRERFDHVVIDAPPLAPVSDGLLLSTLVDGVVLVVDQQRTPRQAAREACARLDYARAKVLGVVLNRADPAPDQYVEHAREIRA